MGRMRQDENIERHRDEIENAALEELRALDGSTRSAVQMLIGAGDIELDELGGFSE